MNHTDFRIGDRVYVNGTVDLIEFKNNAGTVTNIYERADGIRVEFDEKIDGLYYVPSDPTNEDRYFNIWLDQAKVEKLPEYTKEFKIGSKMRSNSMDESDGLVGTVVDYGPYGPILMRYEGYNGHDMSGLLGATTMNSDHWWNTKGELSPVTEDTAITPDTKPSKLVPTDIKVGDRVSITGIIDGKSFDGSVGTVDEVDGGDILVKFDDGQLWWVWGSHTSYWGGQFPTVTKIEKPVETFAVGDRVSVTGEVDTAEFNNHVGTVIEVDGKTGDIRVEFDDHSVNTWWVWSEKSPWRLFGDTSAKVTKLQSVPTKIDTVETKPALVVAEYLVVGMSAGETGGALTFNSFHDQETAEDFNNLLTAGGVTTAIYRRLVA